MEKARIKLLEGYLEERPNDPFLLFALAKEQIKSNLHEEAKNTFESIRKHSPDYTGMYLHYTAFLMENYSIEEAKIVFEEGLAQCIQNKADHDYRELKEIESSFDM